MINLISTVKNWLTAKSKYSRIERFVLSKYPPHKGRIEAFGYDCKPFATVDFIKSIEREFDTTITRKNCEQMLLKLGYERRLYRPPFERWQLIIWLIK